MINAVKELDFLELYKRIVPKKMRKRVTPILRTLYSTATGIRFADAPLKRAEKEVIKSANSKYKHWRLADAMEEVDIVLRENPDQRSALHLKADILARMGEFRQAIILTKKLLRSRPTDLRAVDRLRALGAPYQYSVQNAERMFLIDGRRHQTYIDTSRYLNHGGLSKPAIKYALAGLAMPPPSDKKTASEVSTALYAELAHAHEVLGNFETAIEIYKKMDEGTTAFGKMASRYALCLLELGRAEEAEEVLHAAGAYPDGPIPYNAALIHTLYRLGKIKEAHRTYRARASSRAVREYFEMETDPRDLNLMGGEYHDKYCLFITEGGPGDELRFSSTYGMLTESFASTAITCDPRLTSLLSRSFPTIDFIPVQRYRNEVLTRRVDDRSMLTDFRLYPSVSDGVILKASECHLVCTVLDTLCETRPNRLSFQVRNSLVADPDLIDRWRKVLSKRNRPQIGIAWRSMLMSRDRNHHYLLASDIAKLGQSLNADFWLLQPNADPKELKLLSSCLPLRDPGIDLRDDFENQAALIENLDLVIAPLTTTAELAGALGAPTIIFGRTQTTIWRRNENGSDIWYGNARFVSGEPPNDVPTLIKNIAREAETLLARSKASHS